MTPRERTLLEALKALVEAEESDTLHWSEHFLWAKARRVIAEMEETDGK